MMKKILAAILIAAIAATLYYVKGREATNAETADAAYYSGNIEVRRVNLSFRASGRVEEIALEEGASGRRGDVFARLDAAPLEAEVAIATAARDDAKATLERLENGPRRQELTQARLLVEEYKANLERAESEFKRNEKLVETRAVSESQYETSRETRAVCAARLRKSQEALSLLEEGTRREELEAARAKLAQAEATLERAKIALDDATLALPNDGTILTRVVEPGAVVAVGQTIATLSLRDSVWAYVYLVERDLGRIAPGARVEIRTDSSDKVYSGRVGYVSPEAEFTPKTVETKELRANLVYRARIVVEDPDDGLRQGMPIDAKIQLVDAATRPVPPALDVESARDETLRNENAK